MSTEKLAVLEALSKSSLVALAQELGAPVTSGMRMDQIQAQLMRNTDWTLGDLLRELSLQGLREVCSHHRWPMGGHRDREGLKYHVLKLVQHAHTGGKSEQGDVRQSVRAEARASGAADRSDDVVPMIGPRSNRSPARHQGVALRRLDEWWQSRAEARQHGFLAMPTGSGKTFTAVRFLVDRVLSRPDPCVVWVAHNHFLLEQAEEELRRQLTDAGKQHLTIDRVRGDGHGADANVVLATIQTLARGDAITAIRRAGKVDLVVFDEFHRLAADTWRKVPRRFQRSGVRNLGLSATPFRRTAEKTEELREILPHRIYSVGITELVRARFLADPIVTRVDYRSPRPLELRADELAHLRQYRQLRGDTLDRIAKQAGRDELILETYRRGTAKYESTIVFCCSVDHAESLASLFSRRGVTAASICGSSKDEVNRAKLDAFRRGEIAVATSVLLLTEGVDAPNCRTVFLARPTESPILLSQMIGRAMRGPEAGGGPTCRVVDFVDNLVGGLDFSASHYAFVRDHEESVRELVRREPRPEDAGISMALLLRLREYLNDAIVARGGVRAFGEILEREIGGWLEIWDGHMNRVLLIPHEKHEVITEALREALSVGEKLNPSDREAGAAEVARRLYDEHELDRALVPEEDFVAAASACARGQPPTVHNLQDLRRDARQAVATSDALNSLERDLGDAGLRPEFQSFMDALRRMAKPR